MASFLPAIITGFDELDTLDVAIIYFFHLMGENKIMLCVTSQKYFSC